MRRLLLVLGVLLSLLGALSTDGERDTTARVIKVESENDDIEDISRQFHLEIDRKKAKKGKKKPTKKPAKGKKKPTATPTEQTPIKPTTTPTPTTTRPDPGSSEDNMLEQLGLTSAFASTSMTHKDQENCTQELKVAIKRCEETEEAIEKLKFKKPFIRSTQLTERLGRDSRLFNAIKETIKRVSIDWTSADGGETLIEFFSQKFQKWGEKGGGLSILETRSSSKRMSEDAHVTGTKAEDVKCDANQQYRRIDGKCNNLKNKHQGSAGTALRRFLNSTYEDGVSTPRGGFIHPSLPSPRFVSRKIHHGKSNPLTSKGTTLMFMQFGQFLDHDLSLTADPELECCDFPYINDVNICFNIDIRGDDFYAAEGRKCHSFSRSLEIVTNTPVREQMNGITAYIDASNVYGSDDDRARNLRTMKDGKLKTHNDGPTLPTRRQTNLESHPPAELESDLVAGDSRAIEQPTLASMHSLFLNEHNRIADKLREKKSDVLSFLSKIEQDELLYQETRKLVGAEMQNIVYNDFLPFVLGKEEFNKHKLFLTDVTTYDDKIDASIRNEFATVAFRFGHSLIAGLFNGNGGHQLRDNFFNEVPKFVSGDDGTAWHSELVECARQRSPADDVFCTEDVTDFLYAGSRGANNATNFGDDLPARNIQRGRDHGLPPYNEFRTFCDLNALENFDTRPAEISPGNWEKLKHTYGDVNDIDAFTGGLAETAPNDGHVGPTFACIIGKQFKVLKEGDRFFFNNDNGFGLKANSRETIRQRTFRDIMCDNIYTEDPLLRDVMREEHAEDNPLRQCLDFPSNGLDFDGIAEDIIVHEFAENLIRKVKDLEAALDNKCEVSTCNALVAPGEWTIIQKRGQFGNKKDYFHKDFHSYENGFGSVDKELWIGLKNIRALTKEGDWELQVDLTDWDNKTYFAKYGKFSVGRAPKYQLHVEDYDDGKSTLGDSLGGSDHPHNGMNFTTHDVDNDKQSDQNCANYLKGGWWYNSCHPAQTNLNGLNNDRPLTYPHAPSIMWEFGKARGFTRRNWKASVMKIRRVNVFENFEQRSYVTIAWP